MPSPTAEAGTLVLGLDESRGFAPADGFDARRITDALAGVCANDLTPPVRDPIEIDEIDGHPVVRIDVTEIDPLDKPCFVTKRGEYNGSFIRGGDGDRRLTRYEVTQLLSNRRQPRDDAEPVDANMDDLAPDLVAALLQRVRERNARAFAGLTDEQCLERLGAVADVSGTRRPTLAGLLCLGTYPQQYFPQLFVSFVALPGVEMGASTTDGVRFLDNVSIDGPIPTMVDEAVAVVQRNMRSAVAVRGSRRTDHYDYPLGVVRELVVNAIMHRDYSADARGTQVQIELYADRIELKSPGGLYGGVDVEQLGTEDVSSSRNALIARLLSEVPSNASGAPVCENRGSGLPTVVRLLRDAGMSPPDFVVSPARMQVRVPQHALLSPEIVDWIGTLPARGLSDAQHLALAIMRSNGSVSNQLLRVWGVERLQATQALTDLVSRGIASKSRGRRYAYYRLNGDSSSQPELFSITNETRPPTTREERIESELAAVREAIRAGHLTSRAITAQLGLGYQTVLRRLRTLIERDLVEPTEARHSRAQSYRLRQ